LQSNAAHSEVAGSLHRRVATTSAPLLRCANPRGMKQNTSKSHAQRSTACTGSLSRKPSDLVFKQQSRAKRRLANTSHRPSVRGCFMAGRNCHTCLNSHANIVDCRCAATLPPRLQRGKLKRPLSFLVGCPYSAASIPSRRRRETLSGFCIDDRYSHEM
jgi:hypothetical protein